MHVRRWLAPSAAIGSWFKLASRNTTIADESMKRRFTTLDVFTGERFTGNPLAVVRDGEGLDAKIMQAIAREFGLPETVFVLPAADPSHAARVRIFTPATEL